MNRRSFNRRAVFGHTAALAAVAGIGARRLSAVAQEATPGDVLPVGTPTGGELLSQWEPGQTASINGAAPYYEEHGDPAGQPVLLLHGGLSNAEWWANLAPVLVAADYRVVATDSRGHGRSAWGDKPITYNQMAADALGLLDHLGIPKVDVVGWSDGAITALNLAIHHPERLDRVVSYGANFTPDGVQFVPSEQFPPFERLIADYRRLAPEPGRFEELTGVLNELYKVAPNHSDAELGSIAVPVLVLDGAEEELIKPEHTRRLAELIPGAQLVLIPGTGHFAPFAKPGTFNQIVLDYLAGRAPGGATPPAGTPTS
jgi:pimeloyl-ACP methyl ester carboxylesterase